MRARARAAHAGAPQQHGRRGRRRGERRGAPTIVRSTVIVQSTEPSGSSLSSSLVHLKNPRERHPQTRAFFSQQGAIDRRSCRSACHAALPRSHVSASHAAPRDVARTAPTYITPTSPRPPCDSAHDSPTRYNAIRTAAAVAAPAHALASACAVDDGDSGERGGGSRAVSANASAAAAAVAVPVGDGGARDGDPSVAVVTEAVAVAIPAGEHACATML